MPPEYQELLGALFDVRPVDESGELDVAKLTSLSPQIDLRPLAPAPQPPTNQSRFIRVPQSSRPARKPALIHHDEQAISSSQPPSPDRMDMLRELETELNAPHDPHAVLTRAGAYLATPVVTGKPRIRPILPKKAEPSDRDLHNRILAEIRRPVPVENEASQLQPSPVPALQKEEPGGQQITPVVFGRDSTAIHAWYAKAKPRIIAPAPRKHIFGRIARVALISSLLIGAFAYLAWYGIGMKARIVEHSTSGVQALESAKENLSTFDFVGASDDFSLAYEQFTQAGKGLTVFGASIGSILSGLPGGSKLGTAQNVVEIGKLVADAGQAMSDAFAAIAKTSMLLNPQTGTDMYLAALITPVRNALTRADKNLERVTTLMASVAVDDLPEDKREQFIELSEKTPEFRGLVSQALGYTDFLGRLAGSNGEKRYLVLFQNPSELRPTGGFAGSYGIIVFKDGKFKEFYSDDVYRIDGQLKELYVPPLQLQHITPNWAMRDAAWFVDFSASARKVASFYAKEEGKRVDGVITINPKIVARILEATGPLEMPEYGLALASDNFLATVQNEVEYGKNKELNKPKQIIVDMTPRLIARLASANRDTWLAVVQAFMTGMEERDVLMYFTDTKLQQFAQQHGFSGTVHNGPEDYLMVTFSNIKGSKSDAVTDTSLTLDTQLAATGSVRQALTITRKHNGGSSPYGFYNRQNYSFVRVLVPQNAKLVSISGNTKLSYAPMLNYVKTDFLRDPDLEQLENTMQREQGIVTFQESGKKEFGFWMVVDPGEIKTVELEYEVPIVSPENYQLYVQKQPGLEVSQFNWTLHTPTDRTVRDATPRLTVTDTGYRFTGVLEKDMALRAVLE